MKSIIIIGGGPAGYVAAITAAQQGQEVTLIDQGPLGGTCLNEGCMPTKSLLESAEVLSQIKHGSEFGIRLSADQIEIDWPRVQQRKNQIVSTLVKGIHFLMRKNKVKIINGKASFLSSKDIKVERDADEQVVTADKIIIATGSEPVPLPFAPFDGNWVIHSSHAMSLRVIPSSLVIIGGGVIGCEFASVYSRMGTKVTMVEMASQLLPGEDEDIAAILHKQLKNEGVTIHTSSSVRSFHSGQKKVVFENQEGLQEVQAEIVLVSIGRKPRIEQLGLENIGIDFSRKGIIVNEHLQTNIPNIYACGDVIGGIQLAHVAFHEGTVAALHACGVESQVNYRAVPRCVYTSPEIASVGLTEKQARDQFGDIRIGEFPFSSNGKALIANKQVGKVKVLIEPEFGELLGISIVGAHATELIGQGAVMLHAELTTDILENFIAAHPTLSEAVHEAILSAVGHAVHV
ncbi:dihydrolipoyl dehydrogenase [Robertmurraya korlensis]|uniref:dihydrolipoyl dehydrogenase n=1 Tax=Robertmurraya korlensis TaxID=519977 RepID=UPI0008265A7A|nr:dihydrolipoyl dehydrogenase [Robertmurraya korlensis]